MRIVAGAAKGRRLTAPTIGTRPTSDQAREGLFNTLAAMLDLDGARVLDLYAGSGAVGLEALSRGAAEAVLVESARRAADALRRNVTTVGLDGATVVVRAVSSVLREPPARPFDLVFADPPYALGEPELAATLALLVDHSWLSADAVVVVERAARSPEPQWPDALSATSQRRYGDAVLWYGRRR